MAEVRDVAAALADLDRYIGQVADHFGLPTHVLRHWESVGLL